MSQIDTDVAQRIYAIKAKMLGKDPSEIAKAAGGGAAASADAGGAGATPAAASDGGGAEDMQARIAALKAKMEAGKTASAPKAPAPSAAKAPAKKPAKAASGRANVFPVEPVSRKVYGDERLYGDNTVNGWFILGGLLLAVAVVLMWRRDAVRDWKQWQQRFRENEIARLEDEIAAADEAIDAETLDEIDARLESEAERLAGLQSQLDALDAEEKELDGVFYAANQSFQVAKSELDEMRYNFEHLRILHGDDAEVLADSTEEMTAKQQEVADLRLAADNAKLAFDGKRGEVKALQAEQIELERARADLVDARQRLEASLAKIDHGIFNDFIRNAPMADMLAPTLKVEKIVVEKLKDNYNFMYVSRVDMCTTCHISIDKPYYSGWDDLNEKGERVLNAHPRLDLFVSDDSPHPMGEFGCTVCHLGRGQAVEFERTFHTPAAGPIAPEAETETPGWETAHEKEQRWVADYGYDPERHYWDWPMTERDKLYSSCWQCHQSTDRLQGVPEYNESRELVEDLGCYGCHKIQGLEHLRKPGPDLTNLAAKVETPWLHKWLMDPQGFRPTTRMPHFWNQSNTGAHAETTINPDREWNNNADSYVDDWRHRNEVEARAIAAYVMERSRDAMAEGAYDYALMDPPEGEPDVDAGRDSFVERGCLGCHRVGAEGWTANDHGPDLSAVGSKLSPEWLYSWIMDPKAYYPTTVMPDLRLTEQEAWNITGYLLSMRDESWEAEGEPSADQAVLEDIAAEYLASIAGDDWAREEIARRKAEGGPGAIETYVGEKLFGRFGCSGCHLVPEHYDDMGIGTELTYEALKEITKFDFGHEAAHGNPEAIHHTRGAWFRRKMRDPRVYDRMPVIADGEIVRYDQKIKAPFEKLKMPNYYLDDHEVELLVQFLTGLREDGIDATMKHTLDGDGQLIEAGSRLITKYNCVGCHRMGQVAQRWTLEGADEDELLESLEGFMEEGLENGLWMADAFEADGRELFAKHAWVSDEFYFDQEEEDYDVLEYFEYDSSVESIPEEVYVYGEGEGAMGSYIDEKAMRPPILRGEGAKVHPDWLFEFLLEPYTVRNHVNVRMPTFGLSEEESLALVRWFAAQAGEPWPFEVDTDSVIDDDLMRFGEEKFNEYQCNSCHPAGTVMPSNPDPANWGPDLSMAAARLKPGWVHSWIQDPQQDQPGTKMPNFLGEFSDGEYEPYYEDWEEILRGLQHYLRHMNDWEG